MKKDDFIKTMNRIKMPDDSKIKIRENITSTNKVRYNMSRKLAIVSVAVVLIGVLTIIPLALINNNSDVPPIIKSDDEVNSNIINQSNIVSAESNAVSQEDNSVIESSTKIESEVNSVPATPDESKGGTGGYNYEDFCIHEKVWFGGYHTIPMALFEYVDVDKLSEWEYNASLTNRTEECQYGDANVYNFIREFNISKDMFYDAYYKQASNYISGNYYDMWYDVDILYNGTEQEYSDLYKESGDEIYREMIGRRVEASLKSYLMYNSSNKDVNNMSEFSLPQIIYENNIQKSELEEAIKIIGELWSSKGYAIFNYDIDMIYNKDQNLTTALENAKSGEIYPVQVDEMIRISD